VQCYSAHVVCAQCRIGFGLLVTRDVFEDSMVEAKAKAKATNVVLEVSSRGRGQSSRTPSLGFLPRDAMQRAVMPRRLSVHHS